LTTKQLAETVAKHNVTLAEVNQALVQLTRMSITLHESIKSLETTALAHDAQIGELIESQKNLQKHWQAYLNTRPSI
jgi:predicted membrane-bound spermidine synthase